MTMCSASQLGISVRTVNDDLAGRSDFARPLIARDFVLFEQECHAVGVGFDDFVFALEQFLQIQLDAGHVDPVLFKPVLHLFVTLARLQQRFARDAAYAHASAAQGSRFSIQATLSPSCAARIAAT